MERLLLGGAAGVQLSYGAADTTCRVGTAHRLASRAAMSATTAARLSEPDFQREAALAPGLEPFFRGFTAPAVRAGPPAQQAAPLGASSRALPRRRPGRG